MKKVQRYNWTATGMRAAKTEPHGPMQYISAADHERAISPADDAEIMNTLTAYEGALAEHIDGGDEFTEKELTGARTALLQLLRKTRP